MTATIETFRERNEARQADTLAAYWALVETAADGEAFDELAATAVLRAIDKTTGDFGKDVEQLRNRRALVRTLAAGRTASEDLSAAMTEVETLVAERAARIKALDAEFAQKIFVATQAKEEASRRKRDAREARKELLEGAPSELRERLGYLNRRYSGPAFEAVHDAKRVVSDARAALSHARQKAGLPSERRAGGGWSKDAAGTPEDVQKAERRLERAEAKLAEAQAEVDRLAAEARRVEAEMLQPLPACDVV